MHTLNDIIYQSLPFFNIDTSYKAMFSEIGVEAKIKNYVTPFTTNQCLILYIQRHSRYENTLLEKCCLKIINHELTFELIYAIMDSLANPH